MSEVHYYTNTTHLNHYVYMQTCKYRVFTDLQNAETQLGAHFVVRHDCGFL